MSEMRKLLEENPHINRASFENAQEQIDHLLEEGILQRAQYELDPPSAAPPMVRVDHSAAGRH